MSREVWVQFEIRSMLIMKDTLKKMGIDYEELNNGSLRISREYNDIVINSDTGQISYDEEDLTEVNSIKKNYKTNWYEDCLIREGNTVTREVTTDGRIFLHVNH